MTEINEIKEAMEKIKERQKIREEIYSMPANMMAISYNVAKDDIAYLLAENERLDKENEELDKKRDWFANSRSEVISELANTKQELTKAFSLLKDLEKTLMKVVEISRILMQGYNYSVIGWHDKLKEALKNLDHSDKANKEE